PPPEAIVSETAQPKPALTAPPTAVAPAPAARPATTTAQQQQKGTPKEWAIYRLGQVGAMLALWLITSAILCRIVGVRTVDSFVLGAVLSVVLSFFLRPMLPLTSPADKYRTAPERPPGGDKPREGEPVREIIETVVFVVVLVLMLKTFVAEAF